MSNYKITIIGAGPGGYIAALKAAKMGAKVALIEKGAVGGTCLNVGCIPTKAMIASAKILAHAKRAREFGVDITGEITPNLSEIIKRKDEIVERLKTGIKQLLKTNKVDLIQGESKITNPNKIKVDDKIIETDFIIVATGSKWSNLPGIDIDHTHIVTSDEMLSNTEIPKHLLIIGGGVIGCEFASLFNKLGSKITIVEAMPQILPQMDAAISRYLSRVFKKEGIDVHTNTLVEKVEKKGNIVDVKLNNGKTITVDRVLVSVGRKPNIEGVENLKVETKNNAIKVNEYLQTSIPNIYAIGDVKGGLMLAHTASYEGGIAVQNIMGTKTKIDYSVVPLPIFTSPEIASVGMTEAKLKELNIEYKASRFNYIANGKANCDGETEGQAIFYTNKLGKILGAHIIGEEATSIISEVALAMKNNLSVEAVAGTIHAHPTLTEIVAEGLES